MYKCCDLKVKWTAYSWIEWISLYFQIITQLPEQNQPTILRNYMNGNLCNIIRSPQSHRRRLHIKYLGLSEKGTIYSYCLLCVNRTHLLYNNPSTKAVLGKCELVILYWLSNYQKQSRDCVDNMKRQILKISIRVIDYHNHHLATSTSSFFLWADLSAFPLCRLLNCRKWYAFSSARQPF